MFDHYEKEWFHSEKEQESYKNTAIIVSDDSEHSDDNLEEKSNDVPGQATQVKRKRGQHITKINFSAYDDQADGLPRKQSNDGS